MGFLFGSGSAQTSKETSYPSWVTDAGKSAVKSAKRIAEQPYSAYPNPRVAPFTEGQTTAVGNAGRSPQMVQQGFDLTSDVANTGWDTATANQYMNPFLDAALQPTIRQINEQSAQDAIGARAGTVTRGGVGAFGDAREATMEGQLEEARLRNVGDFTARGYADAYNQAYGAFADTQNRRLASADLMGTQGGRYGATNAGAFAMGEAEQQQGQRSLDVGYGDFLEERDWEARGLDAYVRALSGVPTGSSQTGTVPAASTATQATGLAIAGAGLYQTFFS